MTCNHYTWVRVPFKAYMVLLNKEIINKYLFLKNFNFLTKEKEGVNTEVISMYIPPEKINSEECIRFFSNEVNETKNIKSKSNRNKVKYGLEKIINYLKNIKRNTCDKGLILFYKDDKLLKLNPFNTIKSFIYKCDRKFFLDPLHRSISLIDYIIGLIIVDKSESTIGMVQGSNIIHFKTLESYIPGKTKKGGQSARRYSQIRKNETILFFNKISEAVNYYFLPFEGKMDKIIYGGIIPTREKFLNNNKTLKKVLRDKITKVYNITYTGEYGLKLLLKSAKQDLDKNIINKEIETINLVEKYFRNKKLKIGFENVIKYWFKNDIKNLIMYKEFIVPKVYYCSCTLFLNKLSENCIKCNNIISGCDDILLKLFKEKKIDKLIILKSNVNEIQYFIKNFKNIVCTF